MTLNEYQTEAARTANMELPPREKLATFALGLGGEAGEVQDLIKKHIGHSHDLDLEKIEKEIGDVLWYVAALAGMLGLSLGDVAAANLEKLRARYPQGFDPARSRARAKVQPGSLADPGPLPSFDANGSPVEPPIDPPACAWFDDAFRWKCGTCGGTEAFGANKTEPKRCYRAGR
jgi:NTP pyrophosphatase (non-canonical NTP hydrolase)